MARRRKNQKQTFKYTCTLSGEEYKVTEKAKNPDDLVSVLSYYEMNPEKDDRSEVVKKKLGIEETAAE